jgi:hypothetical protein
MRRVCRVLGMFWVLWILRLWRMLGLSLLVHFVSS